MFKALYCYIYIVQYIQVYTVHIQYIYDYCDCISMTVILILLSTFLRLFHSIIQKEKTFKVENLHVITDRLFWMDVCMR